MFSKTDDILVNFLKVLVLVFFSLSFYFSFIVLNGDQQYSVLSQSFLRGKLHFLDMFGNLADASSFGGKYYWPLGPTPSVLLMPFVFLFSMFNSFFYQGYLQFFLNIGVFYLAKKIAEKLSFKPSESLFLAFAFVFGSVYHQLTLITWSWHYAQVVVTLLLLLSIYEYLSKKRFWLIGVYFGMIFMTRFVAGFGILFFVLMIVKNIKFGSRVKDLFKLFVPVLISGILLLIYNYVRFGSIWENGYRLANFSEWQKNELLNNGLFKLSNIPTNFYYYFINTPELPYFTVKYPGISFFIVSPIFLYMTKASLKNKTVYVSTLTSVFVLIILLSYYWPGWRQVGPRYMVDLLPFLYLILTYSFKNYTLGNFEKILIVISSVFNFYLFFGIFNV